MGAAGGTTAGRTDGHHAAGDAGRLPEGVTTRWAAAVAQRLIERLEREAPPERGASY